MIADRDQENLILTFRFLDDAGSPVTSLLWNTPGINIAYRPYGGSWTELVLVPGTLGTYISSGFIEDPQADGIYELGAPNASRISGHRTLWRFRFGGGQYRYDSVDYVSIPSEETSEVKFEFAIPGAVESFTTDSVIYIKELSRTITFTANQDVSAIPLVLIFEDADNVDQYIIADGDMTKVGDTVTVTLPAGFTNDVTALNWAIRNATDQRVYGTGSISVTYAPHIDV